MENSPLYSTRNIWRVQRLVFGFPLRPENEQFSKFSFNTKLEYARAITFLLISTAGLLMITNSTAESRKENKTTTVKVYFKFSGLSYDDNVVNESFFICNILFCFLYVKQYKFCVPAINKIGQNLIATRNHQENVATNVNKDIKYLIIQSQGHRGLIVGHGIALSVGSLLGANYLGPILSTIKLSDTLVFIAIVIFGYLCCYPAIASSSDLLITHLFHEVSNEFKYLENLMKLKYIEESRSTYTKPLFRDETVLIMPYHLISTRTISSHSLAHDLEYYNVNESIEFRRSNTTITTINYTTLIFTGTCLTKVVRNMDKYFSRMISITFVSCLIGFVSSLYLLSSIFSHNQRHINFNALHLTLTSVLCVHRLLVLIQSGKRLSQNIRKVCHGLHRIDKNNIYFQEFKLMSKSLEQYTKSPLTLFSTFPFDYRALIGMLLFSLILLIFLLQIKVDNNSCQLNKELELDADERKSAIIEGISNSLKKFLCDRNWYCRH